MPDVNYESLWWGHIYDQMMQEDLPELLEDTRRFYRASLEGVTGPVLECACGTGLIWLPLLTAGHDLYGFDCSEAMLASLRRKARLQGTDGLEARLSRQRFESFRYDRRFDAVLIPTNAFAMLDTQEAQVGTLRRIFRHLAPGGRLLLDLQLAGVREIAAEPEVVQGQWHLWKHPETGRPIRQRIEGRRDFNHQRVLDRCIIEYEGRTEDFLMTARWIFKEEFQLLLRLGGFRRWHCFGTPDGGPLAMGPEIRQSYWTAFKG